MASRRYAPPSMSLIIDLLPVWAIALGLFALLWIVSILGYRLRGRLKLSNETAYATSATVSLLVLLIGFTFSLSLSRYDNRRDLVVEEAAAIYSIWEREQLIADPQRAEMARLMQAYVDQRIAYFTFGIDQDRELRADKEADALMAQTWAIVRAEVIADKQPLVTRMLMDNLTRIDDVAWRREALARAHIPYIVVDLLVVFSLLTAASMGFTGPQDKRVHPTHLIFFALNAAAIMLVIDLDRPRSGLVLVSQRPMLELRAVIRGDMTRMKPLPGTTG